MHSQMSRSPTKGHPALSLSCRRPPTKGDHLHSLGGGRGGVGRPTLERKRVGAAVRRVALVLQCAVLRLCCGALCCGCVAAVLRSRHRRIAARRRSTCPRSPWTASLAHSRPSRPRPVPACAPLPPPCPPSTPPPPADPPTPPTRPAQRVHLATPRSRLSCAPSRVSRAVQVDHPAQFAPQRVHLAAPRSRLPPRGHRPFQREAPPLPPRNPPQIRLHRRKRSPPRLERLQSIPALPGRGSSVSAGGTGRRDPAGTAGATG